MTGIVPDEVEHGGARAAATPRLAAAARPGRSGRVRAAAPGRRRRSGRRRSWPRRRGRSVPGSRWRWRPRRAPWPAATIARASGCSLSDSTPPARRSTSASSRPVAAATPVTTCSPLVSVPVLSNSTVSIVRIRSRASRSLTRIPLRAATAVDSEITSGIASPRACGQAITSTVTVRTMASSTSPSSDHTTNVIDPGGDRDVEQQRGEPVGQRLGPAAARLRVGDQPLDAGQRGVVADGVDADPDRRVGRHRAGDDPVAGALGDRLGLAGDHRLVELGLAVDDRRRRPAPGHRPGPARRHRRAARRRAPVARRRRRPPRPRRAAARPARRARRGPGRSPSSPASGRAA